MRIGIDLGGTKIEGIALDAQGAEKMRLRVPTPTDGYAAIVAAIAGLVGELERQLDDRGTVGVGIPGTISPGTGLVKGANTVALIGHPLDRDLTAALDRPVRVANDANCFALSEATDGGGAGSRVVFGAIVGTGVGGGVVVDGQALAGPDGVAGEWGHNPLPWPGDDERPGPDCYCGKAGCIETFLSGPGMARDHLRHAGEQLGAPEIAGRAAQGDAAAAATLGRYHDRMARSLATIINVLDPDVIVLGGGMSNVAQLYQSVPAAWGRYVFSDSVRTALRPPRHGDSSGVRGAAWLWPAVQGAVRETG
jgi:fructokinase